MCPRFLQKLHLVLFLPSTFWISFLIGFCNVIPSTVRASSKRPSKLMKRVLGIFSLIKALSKPYNMSNCCVSLCSGFGNCENSFLLSAINFSVGSSEPCFMLKISWYIIWAGFFGPNVLRRRFSNSSQVWTWSLTPNHHVAACPSSISGSWCSASSFDTFSISLYTVMAERKQSTDRWESVPSNLTLQEVKEPCLYFLKASTNVWNCSSVNEYDVILVACCLSLVIPTHGTRQFKSSAPSFQRLQRTRVEIFLLIYLQSLTHLALLFSRVIGLGLVLLFIVSLIEWPFIGLSFTRTKFCVHSIARFNSHLAPSSDSAP